jgi:hypothetical protein
MGKPLPFPQDDLDDGLKEYEDQKRWEDDDLDYSDSWGWPDWEPPPEETSRLTPDIVAGFLQQGMEHGLDAWLRGHEVWLSLAYFMTDARDPDSPIVTAAAVIWDAFIEAGLPCDPSEYPTCDSSGFVEVGAVLVTAALNNTGVVVDAVLPNITVPDMRELGANLLKEWKR